MDIADSKAAERKTWRKAAENLAYAVWKKTPKDPEVIENLRRLLTEHAQCLVYTIMRHDDDHLVSEAVEKAIKKLPSFKGHSAFTTWVHHVLSNVFYDERRLIRQRREVPLPEVDVLHAEQTDTTDLVLSVRKLLTPEQYRVFELIALQGLTQREVAELLGIDRHAVLFRWEVITRKLRDGLRK